MYNCIECYSALNVVDFVLFLKDNLYERKIYNESLPIEICYVIISYLPLPKITTTKEISNIESVNRSLLLTDLDKVGDLKVSLVCYNL